MSGLWRLWTVGCIAWDVYLWYSGRTGLAAAFVLVVLLSVAMSIYTERRGL